MLKVENLVKIHHALHDDVVSIVLDDKEHVLQKQNKKNFKFLDHEGFRFMKQNPNKTESKYAVRARNGEKITWGIRDEGKWAHIEGEKGAEMSNIRSL